ncbi:MAG: hypothetical protein ACR2IK_05420 [Chloroflexota bacterium]
MPGAVMEESFVCEEGWRIRASAGWGAPDRAAGAGRACVDGALHPAPALARTALAISLADALDALLRGELHGEPLSIEHGAPWRQPQPLAVT